MWVSPILLSLPYLRTFMILQTPYTKITHFHVPTDTSNRFYLIILHISPITKIQNNTEIEKGKGKGNRNLNTIQIESIAFVHKYL